MRVFFAVGLCWLLAGCIESNPQPSPMDDIRNVGVEDIETPKGSDTVMSVDIGLDLGAGDAAWGDLDSGTDALPVDVAPEICVPDCGERACGDDGCGGSCGACMNWCSPCNTVEVPFEDPGLCMMPKGVCATVCCPTCCDNLECGLDGCGGTCGTCQDGEICGVQNRCVDSGDVDDDGVANPQDNCPNHYNPGQEDFDDDGMGDVCDPICGDKHAFPDCAWDLEKEACEASGGTFDTFGLSPEPMCMCPTGDGGCPCSDRTQCQGACFAPLQPSDGFECVGVVQGTCSHTTGVFGCLCLFGEPGEPATGYCID